MALEEPQLNGRIASVIRPMTNGLGWTVQEELRGALHGPKHKPDILITRDAGPPIILENEYLPANTLVADCTRVMGRELDPEVAGSTGIVGTVIAVRSSDDLNNCADGDQAQALLERGATLEYAVYQGNMTTRFPASGFITGSVREMVDFIKPAAEPRDIIAKAAKALARGANHAAQRILDCARGTNVGELVGEILRQPWPAVAERPAMTTQENRQQAADNTARRQTAKMCATIIINALAYQQNLAGYQGIRDLETVRKETLGGQLTKTSVLEEWRKILAINYWPIFHIAHQVLMALPPSPVVNMLPDMHAAAEAIQGAMRAHDVAGEVFQALIADRQTLATYYTRPESTTLAAYLAVPETLNWADPKTLKNYQIADYACGTGGLVLAAYQRARELHRSYGGDPDTLHSYMMESGLTACDIMPAAVHLTSSLLSSVAYRERYAGTRNILYPFGGVKKRDAAGKVLVDAAGNPELAKDNEGNLLVDIGALELLDIQSTRHQIVLPLNEGQSALGSNGKRKPIEVEMTPASQSLVIMNPPFTTPTNHAADHVDTNNPAFAAFGTTVAEQDAMSERVKQLGKDTIRDGYAGLGSDFAAIAHNMVKPGGHIALILPISAMLGGSWDGKVMRSWQKLRQLLAENYADIIVLSIAQPTTWESAFSADTQLPEVIIIARRLTEDEVAPGTAHFVSLKERPGNKLEAQETARVIRQAIAALQETGQSRIFYIGDEEMGRVSLETAPAREKWTTLRISNIDLALRAKALAQGELRLPQRRDALSVPIARIGEIGRVGPVHRAILSAFNTRKGANSGTEYPMLWNHDEQVKRDRKTGLIINPPQQVGMATPPDTAGAVKPGKADAAAKVWATASHLHINMDFQFNANSTAAAFTERVTAGGRAWPNLQMDTVEMEKATCAWLNGTLGIISYWIESNRTQNGRGGTTVTAIPNIPTLDLRRLTAAQLAAAVQIYDDLCQERMLPANEAYRDPVRQELDRRLLVAVLDLDDTAVEQLAILRNQWCMEPTVTGGKSTGLAE